MKINRRKSREGAFMVIFEWCFKEDEPVNEIIDTAKEINDMVVDKFAEQLINTCAQNVAEIDGKIEKYSDSWKLNRLNKVTLAVLRMAFSELLYFPDIPAGATINEAVEIVKKYGGEDEFAFVNGILGSFQREEE